METSEATQKEAQKRYRTYLQNELEAAAVYDGLARVERDPERAVVFRELAQAELRHAARWAERLGIPRSELHPQPSLQSRAYRWLGRGLGTRRVLPFLLRGEGSDIRAYSMDPEAQDLVQDERGHAKTLRAMSGKQDARGLLPQEGWHRIGSTSGSLRAAVLGVNDGLVSNFSLVMGVAGGISDPAFVLLAGVAGLVAGAFSMGAGEYISMRAQRDVYERQLNIETQELEESPEEEQEELVLIYQAKGLSREEAEDLAQRIMANREVALDTMAREELGLDPRELGSPWGAAFSSFAAFVGGALVPILPYLAVRGGSAFLTSVFLSAGALVVVGALLAALSGKRVWWGGLRMLLAGGFAAAVTFSIGRLVGITLVG